MEQESSKVELPIVSYKRLDFGFPTLGFHPNSRAIQHHFPSNLFLPFLNKITHKFYEGIECWNYPETIPPIQSVIEEFQGKLENSIRGYTIIRRARTIPISFCTSKECFHRRPRREIIAGMSPIEENQFWPQIGGKYRIPIYGPFFSKLSILLASEEEVE